MVNVSVCIPVFNPGAYLSRAISSVLCQSYPDYELIIVDDGSTEPVASVVHQFDDTRIWYYQNAHNLGLVANWNRCIELSSGDYITIFHQDDLMNRENLASKVAVLDRHSDVGLVYSDITRINADDRFVGKHYIKQPDRDLVMTGATLFAMVAETGNPIACPAVMVRRACYRQLGGFDSRLPFATDLEMWLRIARSYAVAYVAQPLVSHRVHSKQETARFAGSGRDYHDILNALDIVFSSDLDAAYAVHSHQAYRTLASQAWAMMRWKLREYKWRTAGQYGMVAALAAARSLAQI